MISSLISGSLFFRVIAIRQNINFKILQKIMNLEQTLSQKFRVIEDKLNQGQETFFIINEGLKAYGERKLKDLQLSSTTSTLNKLYENIRNDKELRFSHRKILEFLLGQYDFEKKQFKEINFNRLVDGARVGKNMAGSYLRLLEGKGYVEKRATGYRTFYRLRGEGRGIGSG